MVRLDSIRSYDPVCLFVSAQTLIELVVFPPEMCVLVLG